MWNLLTKKKKIYGTLYIKLIKANISFFFKFIRIFFFGILFTIKVNVSLGLPILKMTTHLLISFSFKSNFICIFSCVFKYGVSYQV